MLVLPGHAGRQLRVARPALRMPLAKLHQAPAGLAASKLGEQQCLNQRQIHLDADTLVAFGQPVTAGHQALEARCGSHLQTQG